ncbi:MAG TPA: hypothetical protein VFS41_09840 [Edaphobacter sp.]|nr:hypothetical protein [Edaphobacter sp.]
MSSVSFAPSSTDRQSIKLAPDAQMVCGVDSVLGMKDELMSLARSVGQSGAMDDLDYFMARPQLRKKMPHIVSTLTQNSCTAAPEAAVLIYEHHIGGRGLHIFATDDTTGRRTLVSAPELRAPFALTACRSLIDRGAQIVLISFRHDSDQVDPGLEEILRGGSYSCRWASREREIAGYLPFESTLDETLALLGTRTRNHLRYYRRRAENQLGAHFVADAKISREDFLALNRICAYAATDEVAASRYDLLSRLTSPVLYGMADREGRWLSLVGGRHCGDSMEMYWQMNRDDVPSQSLGTAMRSFLIDHEVKLGTRRMYLEGGTTHSMSHGFVREKVTDMIVMRQSPLTRILPGLVKRFLPPENMLLQVLEDTTLTWRCVGRA